MRCLIILGLVAVTLGQLAPPGQSGYGTQQVLYPQQGYTQQQFLLPGQYPLTFPIQSQQGQLLQYQYQLPYAYQQLAYNPMAGYPQTPQYPYQLGQTILKETAVQLPLPMEIPIIKEVDIVQPGISGAIPLTTMDAALLELEDQDYGHYEKYFYGRSELPQGFVRPVAQPGMYMERLRSGQPGGVPINKFLRPGANTRTSPFKVNKRDHYEIYKYH